MSGRRSARNKGPRATYTEDPFVSAGIIDEASSEEPEERPRKKPTKKATKVKVDDSASDEEFVAGSEPDIADEDEDEDEDEAHEDGAPTRGGGELDDVELGGIDYMEVDGPTVTPHNTRKFRKETIQTAQGSMTITRDLTHQRGMLDTRDQVGKYMHAHLTYGSDERDLGLAIHMRGRWRWGRDGTFPSRFSLDQPQGESDSPHGKTLGIEPEDLERERTLGWAWYYDNEIGETFRKKQQFGKPLKEAEARKKYLPRPKPNPHTVLLGPAKNQTAYQLGYHDHMNTHQAWGDRKPRTSDKSDTKLHEAWLINIGQKVQCMAWAPNQDGVSQYLAVSAPITEEQMEEYREPESDHDSSFAPSPPYPSAIQLWEFKADMGGSQTKAIDMSADPRLCLALCTEWGRLRQMVWCPMGRERRGNVDDGLIDIGLLGTIWGDGKVRILDVKLKEGSKLQTAKIISPVFEAIAPATMCTSMTWLSPCDIAVGCANGFVAIWSILPSPDAQPYFYHPVHTSYVLNVTSIYPTNPHLVSSISVDGETRLWSILEPHAENTSTVRVRLSPSYLSYSPVLQAVCSADENEYGRLMPVRRFFTTNTPGRVNSTVSALAPCSSHHPSLLFGGTGGEVVANNPMRRIMYGKEPLWQQLWFQHDWVAGSDADSQGVSRFYEGFMAERPEVTKAGDARPMGLSLTTIHDESTHVTALAWNPNRHCAGWASAALGCGLLRVEDIAI